EEVHHEPGDPGVGAWRGQPVVVAELEQRDLEGAPEVGGADALQSVEDAPEPRRARLPRMLVEAPADADEVEQAEAIRPPDDLLDRPGSQVAREVQERPGGRG